METALGQRVGSAEAKLLLGGALPRLGPGGKLARLLQYEVREGGEARGVEYNRLIPSCSLQEWRQYARVS